jgi:hypothetical protein
MLPIVSQNLAQGENQQSALLMAGLIATPQIIVAVLSPLDRLLFRKARAKTPPADGIRTRYQIEDANFAGEVALLELRPHARTKRPSRRTAITLAFLGGVLVDTWKRYEPEAL